MVMARFRVIVRVRVRVRVRARASRLRGQLYGIEDSEKGLKGYEKLTIKLSLG